MSSELYGERVLGECTMKLGIPLYYRVITVFAQPETLLKVKGDTIIISEQQL